VLFASIEGALVFAPAEHCRRAHDLVEQQLLGLGATSASCPLPDPAGILV